jgi:DNA-binding beta-propeller fold protein YncE
MLMPGAQTQAGSVQNSKGDSDMKFKPAGRVRAPELEGGHGWLNTNHPLKLADLRGKIVLLDFWTYCCINCMHIIPELKKLEAKYSKELVVVGVHSAKFLNEKETDNIRHAILRYEISHPVVNDSDFAIWQSYGVHAWPTQVLIDPEGYAFNFYSGEGNYDEIDANIDQLITEYRAKGKLNEKPLHLELEKDKAPESALSFPGKILADQAGQRLFISDSNHNRIVITNLNGEAIDVIGNGQIGRIDGDFKEASFNHPQGLTLAPDGRMLYVADTENHLLRRIDLKNRMVITIAGTGQQSKKYSEFGPGAIVALSSPWDVKLIGNYLFIAMAGPHQIWVMDLKSGDIGPFAGSGREGHMDGPRYKAWMAQPSGITFNGKVLLVADSEISTIRAIDVTNEGEVQSVVGSGDLFGFGDQDGENGNVRLQHPLGVDFSNGSLYVADTYNHKIKIVDLKEGSCKTLLGSGKPGNEDGVNAKFYEPGGLSAIGDKLYIADTNNNAIRVADLKTKEVTTLKISGLSAPVATASENPGVLPNRQDINLPKQKLAPGKAGELVIDLKLPKGYHLNPEIGQNYLVKIKDSAIKLDEPKGSLKNPTLPIKIAFQPDAAAQTTNLEVQLTFYYCPIDNNGACKIKSLVWNVPIEFDKSSNAAAIQLQYDVKE